MQSGAGTSFYDQTESGSSFRILTLLDEYSRRCLAVPVGRSIWVVDVITVVEAAFARINHN
jgi:putative transposase